MTQSEAVHEAMWQNTRRQADFQAAKLAAALSRNQGTSYGLTLVAGCPLPPVVTGYIEQVKRVLKEIAPGLVDFGQSQAYHLTVYGLRRSRAQPLGEEEIRTFLDRLDQALWTELRDLAPFSLPLTGSLVTEDGAVLICGGESETLTRLRAAIGQVEGVDLLKSAANHIRIGQFRRPFGSPQAYWQAMDAIERLQQLTLGDLVVDELKLVYYRRRLLDDLVSQVTLPLSLGDRQRPVRLL